MQEMYWVRSLKGDFLGPFILPHLSKSSFCVESTTNDLSQNIDVSTYVPHCTVLVAINDSRNPMAIRDNTPWVA